MNLNALPKPQREALIRLEQAIAPAQVELITEEVEQNIISMRHQRYSKHFPFRDTDDHWIFEDDESYSGFAIRVLSDLNVKHGLLTSHKVMLLWDDADYVSISLPGSVLLEQLDLFLLPPPLYVFGPNLEWCIAFMMEGDIGFAYARG